jgi:hypothetical protein
MCLKMPDEGAHQLLYVCSESFELDKSSNLVAEYPAEYILV